MSQEHNNNPKKTRKLKGWFNLVDLLVLLAVLLLGWLALRFSAPQTTAIRLEHIPILFTIELQELPVGFHANIHEGSEVTDSIRGFYLGTVHSVHTEPYREEAFDEDAMVIRSAPVDGLETVYIVVEASASISETATAIGLYEIAVGREIFVRSKHYAGRGYVIKIERI